MSLFTEMKDIKFQDYASVWKNNGEFITPDKNQEFVKMEDALSHPNSTEFFPVTVQTMIREAIEPMLIGSSLLDKIQYTPGMAISRGAVGAVTAEDVAEGNEYPEISLNYGTGAQAITIGKSGIAFKFTDEMKRYSQYDELNMAMRAMSRALVRHKEYKVWKMFRSMGTVTHDNVTPGSSVFGTTTGYNEIGTANGSLNLDDIYEAYGQLLMNGFTPNALIVHPLTYTMFLTDPVLRAFAVNHGSGAWYNGWNGNPMNQYPWAESKSGAGKNPPTTLQEYSGSKGSPKIPDYFGLPLQVIISPLVPYDITNKTTDIYLVDTNNIGAIVVDELPTMEEIPDRLRDITKIKVRERYSLVPYNEGNAVAVMKNIKVTPNKLVPQVQVTKSDWTPHTRTNASVTLD